MTGTTWIPASTELAPHRDGGMGMLAIALWQRAVVRPLHRALDAGLRAGELRELGPETLAEVVHCCPSARCAETRSPKPASPGTSPSQRTNGGSGRAAHSTHAGSTSQAIVPTMPRKEQPFASRGRS